MGWDGMGWDAMGCDGMRWDAMGRTISIEPVLREKNAYERADSHTASTEELCRDSVRSRRKK